MNMKLAVIMQYCKKKLCNLHSQFEMKILHESRQLFNQVEISLLIYTLRFWRKTKNSSSFNFANNKFYYNQLAGKIHSVTYMINFSKLTQLYKNFTLFYELMHILSRIFGN